MTMAPTCSTAVTTVPSSSWGDVAVIRDCNMSAEPKSLAFVAMMDEIPPPPPEAVEASEDEDSDESFSEDESISSQIYDSGLSSDQSFKEDKDAKNSVSFGTIQVREYSLTIGTHTIGNAMYPLSLDWAFAENAPQQIDEYELVRTTGSYSSRNIRAPRLDVTDRLFRLTEVTGRPSHLLYKEERSRQLQVMEEKRREVLSRGMMGMFHS